MDATAAFAAWTEQQLRRDTLMGVSALLSWDQQTQMPTAGASGRSAQLALVGQMLHEWSIAPERRRLVDLLQASSDPMHQRVASVARRHLDRAVKLPSELVRRMSEAESEGFAAWARAKEDDDFSTFAPHLQRSLDLSREKMNLIDPDRHPYDVALEDYDPGTTVETLRPLFSRLKGGLGELIRAIDGAPQFPEVLFGGAEAAQVALNRSVAESLGYDFGAGRLDVSAHPFTIELCRNDVRITTHFSESDVLVGLGGTIHEVGHALYEQGLPGDTPLKHTGLDRAASMGLHESQSRFWENAIGRSRPFCEWLAPQLRDQLGAGAPNGEQLFRQSNRVQPSLVRMFADEVTYNLHIIARFELELALFEGTLAVRDVPDAWRAMYQDTLGLAPPDDRVGCLQDVHWAHAAFGYFPSYTLGNLYAASLAATLQEAHPSLWQDVADGRFGPILSWLRENVHSRGSMLDAPDLIRDVCGERDAVEDFLAHVWGRHGALYGVTRPVG
ncbi:MAG: carboxypeptidase M32 [Myxococcota bacterium]